MMDKTLIFIYCLAIINCIAALPASNEQLDKATINDVAANSVASDNKPEVIENTVQKKDSASVHITGISAGSDSANESSTPFKPQKTGSMFARLIDDIFAIPITVLQNVAKLITNPFTQHNKKPVEVDAAAGSTAA